MPEYQKIRFLTYDTVTANLTRLLPDGADNGHWVDARIRADTLTNVAAWARRTFTADDRPGHTLTVFVAPEFFFRYGGPSNPGDALPDSYPHGGAMLTHLVEEVLRPRLAGRGWADWLLIPGTMFWHRPAGDEEHNGRYVDTVAVIRGGPHVGPSRMSHIVDRDQHVGVGRTDRECRRRHVFSVPGVLRPDGAPLVFGLEVGREHGRGGLLGALRTLCAPTADGVGEPPEIDVQVLTACGTSLEADRGVAARSRGYVLRCDGMTPEAEVGWPIATAELQRVAAVEPDGRRWLRPVNGRDDRVLPANLQLPVRVARRHADHVTAWPALSI